MFNRNWKLQSSLYKNTPQPLIILLIIIGLLSFPETSTSITTAMRQPAVATSGPSGGAYSVTCASPPPRRSRSEISTVTPPPAFPGRTRRPTPWFLFGNAYLLTDYQTPYTFTLRTAAGSTEATTIAVEALMRDGFTTPKRGSVTVQFVNGVHSTGQHEPLSIPPWATIPDR